MDIINPLYKTKSKTEKNRLSITKLTPDEISIPPGRSRCPNGFHKNKKTGRCTRKKKQVAVAVPQKKNTMTVKKLTPDEISIPPGKSRCPNGYHKNKKTGRCTRKKKPATATIKNNTPLQQQQISLAIHKLVNENKLKTTGNKTYVSNVVPLLSKQLTQQKSFSPQINQQLVTMRTPKEVSNIFGCGAERKISKGSASERGLLKVMVGTNKAGEPICVTRRNKKAVQVLLNNLRTSKTLDCSRVISPVQVQSNCWFNTMFMTFFISDKGRKFFRFFRQLMIEGKQANGVDIKPPALAEALFVLNACIEACHNITDSSYVKELALVMDTNNVIRRIYKAIPKKRYYAIKNVGVANNPIEYYEAIVNFLGNDSLYIHRKYYRNAKELDDLAKGNISFIPTDEVPDVYVAEILPVKKGISTLLTNKPLSFKINSHKYVLDSAIVRDTKKRHFCSLLTCGGKEMGYDGVSLARMQRFDWKNKINEDVSWTFEGSVWEGTNKNVLWNFCREYTILFYYRVD